MTTSDDAQAAADAAAQAAADAEAAAQAALKRAEELRKAAEEAEAKADEVEGAAPAPAEAAAGLSEQAEKVKAGYSFEGAALTIGALVDGEPQPEIQVRIPLGMFNRHGLVAGATGTGKTKTLQVLAEQLSTHGVPVFAADIKGDLSGIASPGVANDKLTARSQSIGQNWTPTASPTEYFTLGGLGQGVPIRASLTSFGPILLSKVLGLNETQESSLGLVFHYAKEAALPLVDIADLRAVLLHLTSAEGKADLEGLGGLSKATAGVILRELIAFADQGADAFFGTPEIDTADFLRTATDGRGIVSLLEIPGVQDKPALFSTFLMYLLADLFRKLPEVGDTDKPKLVFFFDEAHLLFKDASKDLLATITQTVRLIRSKGVGVFFVTQTPKDVPTDVLAQLGSRIQHQLRAHTPDDAKALRATVSTYPNSGYDLEEVLTQLATGEAIVTVMNEKGAPSPVAWTRVQAPQGLMEPAPADQIAAAVKASPLLAKYGTAVNPESAAERLKATKAALDDVKAPEPAPSRRTRTTTSRRTSTRQSATERAVNQAARTAASTLVREIVKNLFRRR